MTAQLSFTSSWRACDSEGCNRNSIWGTAPAPSSFDQDHLVEAHIQSSKRKRPRVDDRNFGQMTPETKWCSIDDRLPRFK
jgi:hypothetical protein